MATWYRVTQRTSRGYVVHEKIYRFKVWARIVAWLVAGPSSDGRDRYFSEVTEVEV